MNYAEPDMASPHNLFKRSLSFVFFYILILVSVILTLPPLLILSGLLAYLAFHIYLFKSDFLLFPFIVYPFRFVIRVSAVESPFLTLLPEIITLLCLVVFLITLRIPQKITQVSKPKFYLTVFVITSSLIFIAHSFFYDLMYLFVIVRTYIIPACFTLAVIHFSGRVKTIPRSALSLYMVSTTIIAVIGLLQYFNLYKLPNDDLMFFRTLVVGGYDDREYYESERTIASIILPRMNLLSGGSLGSSAGFFFATGILWQTNGYTKFKISRIILTILCVIAALLTLSFSVITALMILGCVYLFVGKARPSSLSNSLFFRLLLLSSIILMIVFLRISEMSLFDYFTDTYKSNPADILSLSTLFFGYGIDYYSSTLSIIPKNNVADIGVFKIFFQTGIFSFILLALAFYHIVRDAIKKVNKGCQQIKYSYLYLFLLAIFLVHQNWMVGSPFYLLFSASAAGILSAKPEID